MKDFFIFSFNLLARKGIQTATQLIAAKKHARSKKGMKFNAVALLHTEFEDALKQISNNKDLIKKLPAARAQLLIKHKHGPHFLFIDVEMKNNQWSFFIFDAASTNMADDMKDSIKANFPSANIAMCKPNLQKDENFCFVFAFSNAEVFSKIDDWHDQLKLNPKIKKNDEGILIVERNDLPPEAMKQSQSVEATTTYLLHQPEKVKNKIISKRKENPKELNLGEFIQLFSKKNQNITYLYTQHKHKKYAEMLGKCLDEMSYTDFLAMTHQPDPIKVFMQALNLVENKIDKTEQLYELLLAAIEIDLRLFSINKFIEENPTIFKNILQNKSLLCDLFRRHEDRIVDLEIVEILLKQGVDPNKKDKDGFAPIHLIGQLSYQNNKPNLISLLADHGADLLIKDQKGKTILDYKNIDDSLKEEIKNIATKKVQKKW